MNASRTAEYKGRKYRLAFLGDTKFGRRAKLQFFDGSKEFWVNASLVREVASDDKGSYRSKWTGCSCGSIEGVIRPSDCWTCKHDAM